MKKVTFKYYSVFIFLISLFIASCQEKDIDSFNKNDSYIYFDIPYQLDSYGKETNIRQDSISYSFALDDASVTDTIIKVVVKVIGTPVNHDRSYKIEIVDKETTMTTEDWNAAVINNRVIKAGELTDTIFVNVKRNEKVKEQWVHAVLRIIPNEEFQIGYANLQTVKVSYSDILAQPNWWSSWESVFGEFCREKYRKWIELYYEGSDTTLSFENGQPLYWNNMPASPGQISWYPTLYMYVRIMKKYFIDNEVYPDGDTSKPRVEIPFNY